MRRLIGIRLKSMFSNMKKSLGGKNKGLVALFILALVFCFFSIEMMLYGGWDTLSIYLDTDFPWLFFAMAGLTAFAFGIFGTVFTTQSQMYEAKDNELLLAMPIKPVHIVLSRVAVLYLLTLLFSAVVMLPAGLVYTVKCGFSVQVMVCFLVSLFLVSMLAQAVTCLLGWLLHFLLAGFRHKAIIATAFMTAVMILYFIAINKLETLMLLLVENGGTIASAIQSFAWPFYALGTACLGNWTNLLLFVLISLAVFALVNLVLTATFVKAMLAGGKSKGAAKRKRDGRVRSTVGSICRKEAKRFFSSTPYLVNIGMGLFMIVAFTVAGIWMKEKILGMVGTLAPKEVNTILPIAISGILGVLSAMTPISAPSVSLEGKNIWILRSVPVSGAGVLKAKLLFHCSATVPLAAVSGTVLALVYRCTIPEVLLCGVNSALLFVMCGILGLVFNMCFPRLDWPNEAAPCKQSLAVLFVMFTMLFLSIGYFAFCMGGNELLGSKNSALVLLMAAVLLTGINALFYLLMIKWGGKKFETL